MSVPTRRSPTLSAAKWAMCLLLLLVANVRAQIQYCETNTLCVTGQGDGQGNVIITVHSSAKGWIGVGLGDDMSDGDMFIAWPNSTKGITLSERRSTVKNTPTIYSTQPAVLIPLQIPAPSWALISFSFKRPAKVGQKGFHDFTATSTYMFAYANTNPTKQDDPNSTFLQHNAVGNFGPYDFTKVPENANGTVTTVTANPVKPLLNMPGHLNYRGALLIHSSLMFVAWGASPFAGIFVARFMKAKLGHLWYQLHVGLMCGLTGSATIVAFVMVLLFKQPPHFKDVHQKLGLIIIILMFVQFGLGYTANALFSPDRPNVPWWDKAHWWVGRITWLAGIINIFLGIQSFVIFGGIHNLVWYILFATWVVLGILALVGGQIWFGTVHHKQGTFTSGDNQPRDHEFATIHSSSTSTPDRYGGKRFH